MITCDYLIIGSGFAGIGLKYKLSGKTILIDKAPFRYKIGESQIPNLFNCDQGLFSLVPKIMKMKSHTRKLGSVFCDSFHGKYASHFSTPLGASFACHCEREEIEKLLVKELSIEIRRETIIDIDLSKNLVVTNLNKYRFKKYVLDCSGPAMVLANQLKLVSPVDQFTGMKAQWSYWTIDHLNAHVDSWANWTVINKIGQDSWIWQIPIYKSKILSMGLLHRGEVFPKDEFIKYIQKYSAACYRLTSIARHPDRAIKPYMKEVHTRFHYSRRSARCSGPNWILVGDAYCFADPVYSAGSGVAMLEAITIANNLNKNKGVFDHQWYEKNCNALLKTLINGIDTWYSGTAFDKTVNERINRTILQGGFSRHFQPSPITEKAKKLQLDSVEVFLSSVDRFSKGSLHDIKVYYFDKGSFIKAKGAISVIQGERSIRMVNKALQKVFEDHIIGQKLSFSDLYLIVELNLPEIKDRVLFWKVIRFIELVGSKPGGKDRLYYFHPEKYEMLPQGLKLGDQGHHLVLKDPAVIEFFETLKGRIQFGGDILRAVEKTPHHSSQLEGELKRFLRTFHHENTFGQNFYLSGK